MFAKSQFARLADVGLKLRRLLCMVLYVLCYAFVACGQQTALQCGVIGCRRVYALRSTERRNRGGNQTGAKFGRCDLSIDAARRSTRSAWSSLESHVGRKTAGTIQRGSTIGIACLHCERAEIGCVRQFGASSLQTWEYRRAGFRAFCGCVGCSRIQTTGSGSGCSTGCENGCETGEKMTRVTLASLDRAARDYDVDNALDALRIASTDRAYSIRRPRRKRRTVH